QSHHDLSIASLVATLDQGNVSVADVLVDHRVAFNFQRIDSLGTNSAEKKPRHTDHFSIFDGVDRSAGGNASDQTHLAHCIRRDVSHVHSQCERAVVVATLNQAALLKRADMFGDRSFRANAEVPRYLC